MFYLEILAPRLVEIGIDGILAYRLQKIMNMIFEMGKAPSDFWKTLVKPLYKKGDKDEFGNYRCISLVSIGTKF